MASKKCINVLGLNICRLNAFAGMIPIQTPMIDNYKKEFVNNLNASCPTCDKLKEKVMKSYKDLEQQVTNLNRSTIPKHQELILGRIENHYAPRAMQFYDIYKSSKCASQDQLNLPLLNR